LKTRIGIAITLSVLAGIGFLTISIYQAIKDFHDEPDGFWE
jgi:hypothetical protein